MSLSKLEKLMYTIGIVDKATGPVNKIMGKMQQLSERATASQDQMMRGFMTAVGGGLALSRSLAPAIDHVAALGEVQSLGVLDADLNQLTKTSFEFSAQWGGNSAEFVRSAYDIQSAISGLTGDELSSFTKASNILAVATKADAGTITSYMGTMYGIFEQTANKMGKSEWVEKIAGQTAKAVQMYKTTGAEMQSAFSALGSKATNRGANSAEQMAVLGELQLVLKSGSVAGTQYASFIDGIGKAEKALNISLTDKNGDMLGMDEMLTRINGRLVGIGSIAKGDILNQAFGSKTAASVVDILSTKVNKLTSGTDELNNVSDASKAIEMANIIASPWDRLSGTFNAAATAMGQRLLPVVEPFVEILAATFSGIVNLTDQFPFLSSVIATLVVGVVGLITVFGIMSMSMGLYRLALISLGPVTAAYKGLVVLTGNAVTGLSWAFSRAQLPLSRFQITAAFTGGYLSALRVAMLGATSSAWAFTAALLANPITWVIASIILLAAVVYRYWKPIKAFMSGFWDGLKQGFAPVISLFSNLMTALAPLGGMLSWVGEKVGVIVGWFSGLLGPVDESSAALQAATDAGLTFGQTLGAVFDFILIPIKVAIFAITKLVDLMSWVGNSIKDFFGFGDDVDVTATKTIDHLVKSQNIALPQPSLAQPNTGIGQSSHVYQINEFAARQASAVKVQQPQSVTSNSAIVDTNNIAQFNSIAERSEKIEQYKQSNQALATTNTQRVSKTNYFEQHNSSSNRNSSATSDNSKRVYIDNLTLKSDDVAADFEQLMELAG